MQALHDPDKPVWMPCAVTIWQLSTWARVPCVEFESEIQAHEFLMVGAASLKPSIVEPRPQKLKSQDLIRACVFSYAAGHSNKDRSYRLDRFLPTAFSEPMPEKFASVAQVSSLRRVWFNPAENDDSAMDECPPSLLCCTTSNRSLCD